MSEIALQQQNSVAAAAATMGKSFDLSPQTFEQALTFAEYLANSDMVPKQYRGKPGDCLIAMQWGNEIGLKTLQALQCIASINGKPSVYGDAGKAILLAAGCIIEEDDTETIKANGIARCKITRPGRPPTIRTFSLEDAKTAGLLNKEGPWRNYPQRQMAWRAFWFAARDAASDILRGMNGAEEVADYEHTTKDMGAAEEVRPTTVAAMPMYPEADFEKNFGTWSNAIAAGRKTPDQVIDMVQTKAQLSEQQKDRIRKAAVIDADGVVGTAPTQAQQQPGQTGADAKAVEKRLREAKDVDALDIAADYIRSVKDADQAQALTTVYHGLRAQLTGA